MTNRWLEDYPEEPEFVHKQVMETLEKIQKENTGDSGRRNSGKKVLRWTVILAATFFIGVTAFAAMHYHLLDLLKWRIAPEKVEGLIQTEPKITQPETLHISAAVDSQETGAAVAARSALEDPSPLLDIREVLFDGMELFIYGVSTENGKKYDLNADRIYVNEVETGPVTTTHLYPGNSYFEGTPIKEEGYTFEVDLTSMELTDAFEVTLPLSVYERENAGGETGGTAAGDVSGDMPVRCQNQDMTFQVEVLQPAVIYQNQSFVYKDFQLELTELMLSATSLKVKFHYKMTGEQMEAYQNWQEELCFPVLRNEKGEECSVLDARSGDAGEDGIWMEGRFSGISGEDTVFTVVTQLTNRFQETHSYAESLVPLEVEADAGNDFEDGLMRKVSENDAEINSAPKIILADAGTGEKETVTYTIACQQGMLEVNALVKCPEDAAYSGTLKTASFDFQSVKSFFGDEQYWQEVQEGEVSADYGRYLEYRETDVFQNTFIYGSVTEYGNRFNFEMSLNSSAEYPEVKERIKFFTSEQVLERFGINAHIFTEGKAENYVFELMQGKLGDVKAAFYSPVRFFGGVTYEYGDITSAYFTGNYEIAEKEPVELLPMEKILEKVQDYAAAGEINPVNSGDAVSEIELQYYLEEQQGERVFTPVWVFKVPHRQPASVDLGREESEEYFYMDAVSGELLEYLGF